MIADTLSLTLVSAYRASFDCLRWRSSSNHLLHKSILYDIFYSTTHIVVFLLRKSKLPNIILLHDLNEDIECSQSIEESDSEAANSVM